MSRFLNRNQIDALYDALDAGMSQRAIAKRLGCSVSTVNDWKQKRERREDDAGYDAPDPNEVLDFNSLEDRALAAWRLCRQTEDVEERMDLLQAAIWPDPRNYDTTDDAFNYNRELIDSVEQVEAAGYEDVARED